MEIARACGMIDRDATVGWTYFIDLHGVPRTSHCYPPTVGRSIPEMLRLLDALLRVPHESAADIFASNDAADRFYAASPDKDAKQ